MKKCNSSGKLIIFLFVGVNLAIAAAVPAGTGPDYTRAELMGNSATIIRQHYSHLLADKQGLREKLERFKKSAVETRT